MYCYMFFRMKISYAVCLECVQNYYKPISDKTTEEQNKEKNEWARQIYNKCFEGRDRSPDRPVHSTGPKVHDNHSSSSDYPVDEPNRCISRARRKFARRHRHPSTWHRLCQSLGRASAGYGSFQREDHERVKIAKA